MERFLIPYSQFFDAVKRLQKNSDGDLLQEFLASWVYADHGVLKGKEVNTDDDNLRVLRSLRTVIR